MPLRDYWWCILVAKYGVFLFTESGAFLFTDYTYGVVHGKKAESYLHERVKTKELDMDYRYIAKIFTDLINEIDCLKSFFIHNKEIDRNDLSSSILFRPIGQNILFDVLKVGISEGKRDLVISYFKSSDFSLVNSIWRKIFWDTETSTIITDKMRQRLVTILILEKLGFNIKRTSSDLKKLVSFGISKLDI